MTTSQDATLSNASGAHTPTHTSKWNLHDTQWTLSLFGTAVGAGILFLPINIGVFSVSNDLLCTPWSSAFCTFI